jgi:hypothetical protein
MLARSPSTWPIVSFAALLAACTTSWGPGVPTTPPRNAIVGPDGATPRCVRLTGGPDSSHRLPLADAEQDPALAAQLADIPRDVRRIVLAAGLEPALARLLKARADGAPVAELMPHLQAITLHLQSLKVQVDATAFEADCIGDLLETQRASIDQERNGRELKWTVVSLVVGAAGAIGAGAWQLADPDGRGSAIVGIAGGVVAAGLGIGAFVQPERQIVLTHERNLLAPIATGHDPGHVYPTFVFRLLTSPQPDGSIPREALQARFDEILDDAIGSAERTRAAALVFGTGGIYDTKVLEARERMLDELESTVAAFSRDLEILQRFLGRTFDVMCLRGDSSCKAAP